jgi:spermidine synthase
MHLALALKPDAKRVLVVGLGGGSIIKRMWRDYPEVTIDAVEIDPVVVDVAERYFELPSHARIDVTVEDGRRFLRRTDETYDIIIMDAYYADALPFHLTTVEFFREARARLAPGGVLAYNVISAVEGPRSDLFRSMYRTVGGVWEHRWVFPIGIGTEGLPESNRNIIVLATDNRVSEEELRAQIENRVAGRVTVPGFDKFGRDLYLDSVRTNDVPLLTDQHAPTDSLIDVN